VARLGHRPTFVCASQVILVARFMVVPEMVLHSRHTTRLIGPLSLCKTTFQGGSVASLFFSLVRVSFLFLAFVVVMVRALCHEYREPIRLGENQGFVARPPAGNPYRLRRFGR
jgi:hypothetical protein